MNKATRQLLCVQKQVVRLTVDLSILKARGVSKDLLLRRQEELDVLKDKLGIRQ